MDLRLTDDGDLDMAGHDLLPVQDLAELRQRLRVLLEVHEGEWFLDGDYGIPWRDVLGSRDLTLVRSLLREEVSGLRGVRRITGLEVGLDVARVMRVAITVLAEEGEATATAELAA